MESGGDLLVADMSLLPSIDIAGASIYGRQQLRVIEPPEGLLPDLQQFPDQGPGGLHTFEPLARPVRNWTDANGDSTKLVVRSWRQCAFGN